MKLFRSTLFALALLLTLTVPALAQNGGSASADDERGYMVIMNDFVIGASQIVDVAELSGGHARQAYTSAFNGATVVMTPEQANRLLHDPRVKSVIEEVPVQAVSQTTPTGVQRIDTPGIDGSGPDVGSDINIAVLDTGIDLDHPDLNVGAGINCVDPGVLPDDDYGHGTHVAGTVAAHDNGDGVVGVAPGAVVHPVKVLNSSGSSVTGSLACGLNWVLENSNSIDVVNMSLGGQTSLADEDNCGLDNGDGFHQFVCAIVDSGVTVVVAAGNSNTTTTQFLPARYREAVTVSALADSDGQTGGNGSDLGSMSDDSMASFSNYGDHVDVIAPGVSILSTTVGGNYGHASGTSMAAPHVAGAAATYIHQNPGASPSSIDSALKSSGGFDWTGDKDSTKEPLINVSTMLGVTDDPATETRDAAVASVSAPSSVTQGETATISATIENNGSTSDDVAVSVSGSPSGFNDSTSVTLAANSSTTVDFTWATDTATQTGNHTFTVSAAVTSDSDSSNNSATAIVDVQAADSGDDAANVAYVSNIRFSSRTIERRSDTLYYLYGNITIKADGENVSDADVTLRLSGPGLRVNLTTTTSSTGIANFGRYVRSTGTYTVSVLDVTKDGLTYDASLNSTSSASITVGEDDRTREPAPDPEPDSHDAALTSISAPSTIAQGETATISATVKNNGSVSEQISVNISGSPSGFSDSTSVTLSAGASTTVSFAWTTDGSTATGTHTVTATASVSGDSNTGNDSDVAAINVKAADTGGDDPDEPVVDPDAMYVDDIRFSYRVIDRRDDTLYYLYSNITIKADGEVVTDAEVTVRLSGPGLRATVTTTTNSTGMANIGRYVRNTGTYTISVVDVSKTGEVYDADLNDVTDAVIAVGDSTRR